MWILWSTLLGIGLAADAFAVSISDGLKDNKLRKIIIITIALFFGVFQGVMPLLGYLAGGIFDEHKWFKYAIPIIGFTILAILGTKSIIEAFKSDEEKEDKPVNLRLIFIQAVATSIDALTVGIGVNNTISATENYQVYIAFIIIAVVTFLLSLVGVLLGMRFKDVFSSKAEIIGGIILIAIAIKIMITFVISL